MTVATAILGLLALAAVFLFFAGIGKRKGRGRAAPFTRSHSDDDAGTP